MYFGQGIRLCFKRFGGCFCVRKLFCLKLQLTHVYSQKFGMSMSIVLYILQPIVYIFSHIIHKPDCTSKKKQVQIKPHIQHRRPLPKTTANNAEKDRMQETSSRQIVQRRNDNNTAWVRNRHEKAASEGNARQPRTHRYLLFFFFLFSNTS